MLVQRDRQFHPPVHARGEVVAVVLADAAQLMLHLDADRLQQLRLADARTAPARAATSPRRPPAIDLGIAAHLVRLAVLRGTRPRPHACPRAGRVWCGLRSRPASSAGRAPGRGSARAVDQRRPFFCVTWIIAEAFLPAVVVVRVPRPALGRGGVDEGIQQFGALDHVGDVQQSAVPARLVAARLEVLGLAEIRAAPDRTTSRDCRTAPRCCSRADCRARTAYR